MLLRCHLGGGKKGQGKSNTSVWTQSQKKKVQQSIWVFMSIVFTRYSTASNDPYDENNWNEDGFEIYSRAAIVNLSWEHRDPLCYCLEIFIRRSHFKSVRFFFFTPYINSNINMHYSRQAFMQRCLWDVPGLLTKHTLIIQPCLSSTKSVRCEIRTRMCLIYEITHAHTCAHTRSNREPLCIWRYTHAQLHYSPLVF